VPASVTKRTSCHITDGDDDVNRSLYFVSIDVFYFSRISLHIYMCMCVSYSPFL